MARKSSAGIVLYRIRQGELEVFLVHPGGPYWAKKDDGAWSIPKGEFEPGEDPLATARREFLEETGSPVTAELRPLPPLKQPSGKVVHAWAAEGDIDAATVKSNLFAMEWPPRSGLMQNFPEVDKGAWFTIAAARQKLLSGQRPFLDELQKLVDPQDSGPATNPPNGQG
ncbi:NUDIX domain-containing protein [Crenobacter sp. SG2305]|uniref:NUDIX domain-containing protein n=1 Tax=Crenobacter oryzisoli TaxID=3056844 RepID=UPI0025AA37BE|nr:NUDIX domain-containing protein [Crenobacter sp. SG2305]MDN0085756.1 NUDIX domain-containing protein [Crenobacter sp. SG2305]